MASHQNTRTTRTTRRQPRRDDRSLKLAHEYYRKSDERRQNCAISSYAVFGSCSLAAVIWGYGSTILSTISTTLTNIIPFIGIA